MNKGEHLPATDHVTRHVGGSQINDVTGMPDGSAFERRSNDEDGPSFNWIEHFALDSIENAVEEIRKIFENEKKFNLRATAVFAALHIGTTTEAVREATKGERILAFIYDPIDEKDEKDPSHAIVPEIKFEDNLIADVIADTVIETFPARGKSATEG